MADDRVIEWAQSMRGSEVRAFMRARRRFLKRPSSKHLRELRAAAGRLRSLFEDFRDMLPWRKRNALRRLICLCGEARDAQALRSVLGEAIDARERTGARMLARDLRTLERRCFRRVRRLLAPLQYTA